MKFFFGLVIAVISCFAMISAEKPAACLLRHSLDGDGLRACAAFFPSWSYKAEDNSCVEFVYGGCGGNANRFGTQEECEKTCKQ